MVSTVPAECPELPPATTGVLEQQAGLMLGFAIGAAFVLLSQAFLGKDKEQPPPPRRHDARQLVWGSDDGVDYDPGGESRRARLST